MSTIIFKTEEAIFQFDRKSVMECLERRKSISEIKELDTLIDLLSNQSEQSILSSAEQPYFGFILLDLIDASGQGSAVCENCGKRYSAKELEAFIVGPENATFKTVTAKKNLFRKKPKLPGMQGGKGYKCPRNHILIYMQTWTT